jgi:hypothetical protein
MASRTNRKKERIDEFFVPKSGGSTTLSGDLLFCSFVQLKMALDDRRAGRVFKEANNHASAYALGSILLLIAGFESWLNELLGFIPRFSFSAMSEDELRKVLHDYTPVKKYEFLANKWAQTTLSTTDLEIAIDIRDEITHYLPRPFGCGNDRVPSRFHTLQQQGLFITSPGDHGFDFTWGQKLGSYGLAFWVSQVVKEAVDRLAALFPADKQRFLFGHQNFAFATRPEIYPPSRLDDFDHAEG